MHNSRPIRFFHRGAIQEIAGLPATTPVLHYLREHARCAGSKEGCMEGDCGACTVLLGELQDGEIRLHSANACMLLLPMLDGRALFSVEDLGSARDLNPVQQALVDCHGSQCGFCTPGFAMSMQLILERQVPDAPRPDRQQLADALAGNLCRCTGYRPILDAAERMFELPPRGLSLDAARAALQQLQADPPLHYRAANPAQLEGGQPRQDSFHAPRTLAGLAALRLAQPEATLLAGATDIALWIHKQHRDVGSLIHTGSVAELRALRSEAFEGRPGLWIGAAVPLEQAWAALVEAVPELRELWLRFASPPVRHAGTLGGNIANGSPIGDGAPALIALGAAVVLRRGEHQRRLPLQDFYLDYMKNALRPGELLEALHLPLPGAGLRLRAYKIAKRHDSDISAVCAAFALRIEHGLVAEVRLAYGGMAATVRRAAAAEAALLGQPWEEPALQAAMAALAQDFKPLSDLRASAGYRLRVAANLLRRAWLETRERAPLPAEQTRVWCAADHGQGHDRSADPSAERSLA